MQKHEALTNSENLINLTTHALQMLRNTKKRTASGTDDNRYGCFVAMLKNDTRDTLARECFVSRNTRVLLTCFCVSLFTIVMAGAKSDINLAFAFILLFTYQTK